MGILSEIVRNGSYLFLMGYDEEFLKEYLGIEFNNHHAFPSALKENVKKSCDYLLDEIDFDYTKRLPVRIHLNNNLVFAGDFFSHEVLGKLLRMVGGNYSMCNGKRAGAIEFAFHVHVYKNKKIAVNIAKVEEELEKKPDNYWRMSFNALFDLFNIDIVDAARYLEKFFFHEKWRSYHDNIMKDLSFFGHNGDRKAKLNGYGNFKYFIENRYLLDFFAHKKTLSL